VDRRISVLLLILCCLPLAGCVARLFGGGGVPTVTGQNGSIPLSKLDRIIFNFADREVTLISDACEAIKREAATTEARRCAQHLKLANGTSVYDIVTSPNSLGHLVDLYVMIHLQHLVLVGEGTGERLFGEKGAARLRTALNQVRNEVEHLADLSMKSKRRELLDTMIQDWRRRNPDVELVSGIRFGTLPELSGKTILEAIPSFFDVLNPMDDTNRSVEETRELAERVFYFSKRLPKLLDWQTDSALDDALAKQEVCQVLKDVTQTSGAMDRISKVFAGVPDLVAVERKEVLAAWDARQVEGLSTLREIRSTLAEGKDFALQVGGAAKALELTFHALNRVIEPPREGSSVEAGKSFDIAEYASAATEIAKMARDADSLVNDGHSLLTSPVWVKRQEDASRLADEAVGHAERGARRAVDHFAWRMVQVLIGFFSLLLVYRVVVKRLERPRITPRLVRIDAKADPLPPMVTQRVTK